MISSSSLRPIEQLIQVAENRTSPSFLQKESRGAKFQLAEMQKWSQEGEWISILKSLWSDEEGQKALEWLRSKELEHIPPLLYEQAIAEFIQNPTLKTASKTSIPLIVTASLSLRQQQIYIQEKALVMPSCGEVFENKYFENLNDLISSSLKTSLPELILSSDSSQHILRKVHNFMLKEDLPTYESLKWLLSEPPTQDAFKPILEWKELRQSVFFSWTQEWRCGPTSNFLRYLSL